MVTKYFAKPILDGRFWILEEDGRKLGTICKQEDRRYMFSCDTGTMIFDNQRQLQSKFNGSWMWGSTLDDIEESPKVLKEVSVYDYPSKFKAYNQIFDVQKKLPLFTKSKKSKSLYCAGYYIIKFEKGWVRSFCPKMLTLDRYPFKGPFRTQLEMKQELANANKNSY